jgi:hypothetical protein
MIFPGARLARRNARRNCGGGLTATGLPHRAGGLAPGTDMLLAALVLLGVLALLPAPAQGR